MDSPGLASQGYADGESRTASHAAVVHKLYNEGSGSFLQRWRQTSTRPPGSKPKLSLRSTISSGLECGEIGERNKVPAGSEGRQGGLEEATKLLGGGENINIQARTKVMVQQSNLGVKSKQDSTGGQPAGLRRGLQTGLCAATKGGVVGGGQRRSQGGEEDLTLPSEAGADRGGGGGGEGDADVCDDDDVNCDDTNDEEEDMEIDSQAEAVDVHLLLQSRKSRQVAEAEPLRVWPLPSPPVRPAEGQGQVAETQQEEGRQGQGRRSESDADVVEVPAVINGRLLEHQREGVKFLYRCYRERRGAVLADDMGLGKTIQTIAFLSAVFHKTGSRDVDLLLDPARARPPPRAPAGRTWGKTDAYDDNESVGKAVLVVAPTSVLHNWEREFESWGTFRVGLFHGASRDAVMRRLLSGHLEVVITSYDTCRVSESQLCSVAWHCVVVDEVHRLKSHQSQLYRACSRLVTMRRYGLSGTVMHNRYGELFNVFDWAAPGCLGSRAQFRDYYDSPLKMGQRINAPAHFVQQANERKARLVEVLARHMVRRTKGATMGHLLSHGKEDNVVFCAMAPLQKAVYRRVLRSPDFRLLALKDEPCSCGGPRVRSGCCHVADESGPIWAYLHADMGGRPCDRCPFCLVLPCLTKLQQVSNHLELIKASPRDPPAKHEKDAAFARLALGGEAALVGGMEPDESFWGRSDAAHCGKMRALEKLLRVWAWDGDKVLLFSYSVKMLDILDRFLVRRGYCFARLDGATPMAARQALADDFNSSPSKQIFLISTRAGGQGLNLVGANRVVIFDPHWNPAFDMQAQDRSFRYGQQRRVVVYRLLSAGSLEELVYTRQIYKQQQFNIAMEGASEKRYFEGVQGSKQHQGELFGIGNLLKDLSHKVFTSDIIEGHEERLLTITRQVALPARPPLARKRTAVPGGSSEGALEKQGTAGPSARWSMKVEGEEGAHGLAELAKLLEAEALARRQQVEGTRPPSPSRHRGHVEGRGYEQDTKGGLEGKSECKAVEPKECDTSQELEGPYVAAAGAGDTRGETCPRATSHVGEEANGACSEERRSSGRDAKRKAGGSEEGVLREGEQGCWEEAAPGEDAEYVPPAARARQQRQVASLLQGEGVVYAHRNEEVVNMEVGPRREPPLPPPSVSSSEAKRQRRGSSRQVAPLRTPPLVLTSIKPSRREGGGTNARSGPQSEVKVKCPPAERPTAESSRHTIERQLSEHRNRSDASGGSPAPEVAAAFVGAGGEMRGRKAEQFQRMAAWKGMAVVEFSRFISALTATEKAQLLEDFKRRPR